MDILKEMGRMLDDIVESFCCVELFGHGKVEIKFSEDTAIVAMGCDFQTRIGCATSLMRSAVRPLGLGPSRAAEVGKTFVATGIVSLATHFRKFEAVSIAGCGIKSTLWPV